jgi:hypothetical protein
MAFSYFHLKAFSTFWLLFILHKINNKICNTIYFVPGYGSEAEDSDFEDLDTESFPLPDKCPTPPAYEPPPPYDN